MAKLLVTNGPERQVVALPGDAALTVGRDPENSVTIEGADVSRRHCRLEPDGPNAWRVVDLGSKNGTFLNGKAIGGPTRLVVGDRLAIGDAALVVLADEPIESGSAPTPAQAIQLLEPSQLRERPAPAPWGNAESFGFDDAVEEDDAASSTTLAPPPGNDRRATRNFLKDRLLRLNLLSQEIASELDLDRLLDSILDAVLDFTAFERGLLLLVEEGGDLKPVRGRRFDLTNLATDERSFSRKVIDLALKRRDATLVRDEPLEQGPAGWDPKTSWTSLGLKSALCLPLSAPIRGRPTARLGASDERRRARAASRLLGALYLDSTKEVRPFDAKDRQLLRMVGAQAAIALQNARLHQQATTDPLTQLANRGFFEQLFQEEIRRAREQNLPFALLLLDIDHFKQVNDRFGHQAGDAVLREVARRVRDAIRRDDVAGRYGGEEFVILLPGAGLDAAKTVAQKIRTALKASPLGAEAIPVTASIGIAVFPDHGRDAATLTKRADQALYVAKNSGRDRAEVWRAQLDRSGHRQDALAGMLSGDAARDQRNLKVLLEMLTLARAPLEKDEYLWRVLDKVIELTRAERSILFLGDDPDRMRLAGIRVRGEETPPAHAEVLFSSSSVRLALKDRRALCLLDAADGEWQRSGASASIESLRLKTVMCVPLVTIDRVIGVLYVDDRAARREFSQQDLIALEALGHQLALALALDPRFAERADEVSHLQGELRRLREENEELREQSRAFRRPPPDALPPVALPPDAAPLPDAPP